MHQLRQQGNIKAASGAGVVLTATNTLMAEIAQDWSTPTGQQLITLLFTDVFPALGAGIAESQAALGRWIPTRVSAPSDRPPLRHEDD